MAEICTGITRGDPIIQTGPETKEIWPEHWAHLKRTGRQG